MATHCFELMQIIRIDCDGDIEFGRVNFNASGIESEIADPYDGQIYELKITPKYESEVG